jgi:CofD-related protein of GAK system
VVRPATNQDLHLVADTWKTATYALGQHNITGKEVSPISSRILRVYLTKERKNPVPLELPIRTKMRKLIEGADLICYPMGSFYSSVVANLLLKGMGDAIALNPCPKVFIPSTGKDPEAKGLSLAAQVKSLLDYIGRSASGPLGVEQILHFVLLDSEAKAYPGFSDLSEIERLGVRVIRCPLVSPKRAPHMDERLLAPILVSLA